MPKLPALVLLAGALADGSKQRRLTRVGASQMPAWSPDGGRIAFTSGRDGNDDIYAIDVDGRSLQRLTRPVSEDFGASWSPDGRRLLLTSLRNGSFGIDVMNADGKKQRRLLDGRIGETLLPRWSSDGRRIAFQRVSDSGLEICVVNANGSGFRQVTHNDWLDAAPAWQPVAALRK